MSRCSTCHGIKNWDGPIDFAPVDGYCTCIKDLKAQVERLEAEKKLLTLDDAYPPESGSIYQRKISKLMDRVTKLEAERDELEKFLDVHHYPVSGWKTHFENWKAKGINYFKRAAERTYKKTMMMILMSRFNIFKVVITTQEQLDKYLVDGVYKMPLAVVLRGDFNIGPNKLFAKYITIDGGTLHVDLPCTSIEFMADMTLKPVNHFSDVQKIKYASDKDHE